MTIQGCESWLFQMIGSRVARRESSKGVESRDTPFADSGGATHAQLGAVLFCES